MTTRLLRDCKTALLCEVRQQSYDLPRTALVYAVVKAIDALLRYEAVREGSGACQRSREGRAA